MSTAGVSTARTAGAEMAASHEWRLVAPWWNWPLRRTTDPAGPQAIEDRRAVRVSRPVLQMYDSADLVNVFLADPQRRLAFDRGTDEVWTVRFQRLRGEMKLLLEPKIASPLLRAP